MQLVQELESGGRGRQSRQSTEATRGRGAKATETVALAQRRESSSGTGADFRLQTRTFFLMWEKPSQQTPGRLQIPIYVSGTNTGKNQKGEDIQKGKS